MTARRGDTDYEAQFAFAFGDERSATVYAPLCRLFMYALISGLWPERSRELNASLRWSAQEGIALAAGLSLSAGDIAALAALTGRAP